MLGETSYLFRLDLGYLADATGFAVMATYRCVSIVSLNKSSGLWFTDVATNRYFFCDHFAVLIAHQIFYGNRPNYCSGYSHPVKSSA
jgi:hypothetical protein